MSHDATSCNGTPPSQQTPRIEPEGPDDIRVGGGKLSVPHEDFGDDLDDGTEMDLVTGQPLKVRRPHRREWCLLKRDSEIRTCLLVHKPNGDGIEEQYFYIEKPLRGPISADLKAVRVFLYYSLATKNFGFWVVKVTRGNTWYEGLHELFRKPVAFFAENAIRVASDRDAARYRVKSKPSPVTSVAWPAKTMDELLGEALGEDHFIRSSKHPVYRDLLEGSELR
jgi:hypothetical protein